MYRVVVKTADLSRNEWLKYRTQGIGGSDVSIIAGINPFRSAYQLWLEKTGQAEPEEAESEYAHFGTLLEPIVRNEFTRRTGIKVRQKHMLLQSAEYPFMFADLDGVINEGSQMAIFEAKTASQYKAGQWEEAVPAGYLLQVQHYMAVTGAGKAYVAALVGGSHFYIHTVQRDEELIGTITAMEKEFWEKNVLGGAEPVPDGSEATTAFLSSRYARCNGMAVELPDSALEVIRRYEDATEQVKAAKERKDALANQLRSYLGENEAGTVQGRTVTWKQITKTTFDSRRLEKENRQLYDEYLTESRYRRLSVA